MASVGILGGTFNPPHVGHLVCAQEAHAQLGLDVVVLMPVHAPPHKPLPDDPGVDHRVEMCRLAAGDDVRLAVSRWEADRPGPSFTVDTLRALHERSPEDDLTFVVGGDMAATLPTWREPAEVLRLARLAIAERDGAAREAIREALTGLGAADRATFLDMPRVDVSSSLVRERVAAGRPVRNLVPDAVVRHIAAHRLYGAQPAPR